MKTRMKKKTRGLVCPYCKELNTHVIDTVPLRNAIRRYRECLACRKRFVTKERIKENPA
jgi:transcriptional repressor NrdR